MRYALTICFLLLPSLAGATDYYMRASGTNADPDCSESSACCAGAMDMSDFNAGSFSATDVIYMCDDDGDYTTPMVIPSSGSTGAGNRITIQAATGDTPVIQQPDATNGNAWVTVDQDYIVFEGITFDGNRAGQSSGYGRVVVLNNASNVTFTDCTFTGSGNDSDTWAVGSTDTSTYITIEDSTFSNNWYDNVYLSGDAADHWTIDNNTFTTPQNTTSIAVRSGPDYVTITDNTITGGDWGIMVGNNAAGEESIDVTITGNTIDEFGDSAYTSHAIQVFVDGNSDTYVISDNTVSDPVNDYDGYELAWQGNPASVTIDGNTFTNDSPTVGDYGLVVDMFATGTATITNNRIYDVPHTGIYILGGSGHTITGNLVKDSGGEDAGFPALTILAGVWEGENCTVSNHTVAYNIIDTCERGIWVGTSSGLVTDGVDILNNVVYGTYGTGGVAFSGIEVWEEGTGTITNTEIKNNIIYDGSADYFVVISSNAQSGLAIDNNLYYGSASWKWGADADDTTLTAWQSATSDED